MSNGFQTAVANQPGVGIPGDFASANPKFSVDAGPGGIVSGPSGVIVGRFAWLYAPADGDGAPSQAANYGPGAPAGFVANELQGLNTIYLADASLLIPTGFQMGLFSGTDFWAKNDGLTQVTWGATVYVENATGKVRADNVSGSATGTIAAGSFSVTGGIANDTLTVSSVQSGTVAIGALLTANAATGTTVVSQLLPLLAGEALGGVGRYSVSIPEQNVASVAGITGTYGLFTAVSGLTGTFGVGSVLSGAGGGGVSAGSVITALGTAAGGLGTYIVNLTQTVTSTAIAGTLTTATKWKFQSSGLPGETVKITSQPLG